VQRELILREFNDLNKAVSLLKASIRKFKPYRIRKIYTPLELEYYDSLAFRFGKTVELFLHFFKGLVKKGAKTKHFSVVDWLNNSIPSLKGKRII
jgi:hypothetical protein